KDSQSVCVTPIKSAEWGPHQRCTVWRQHGASNAAPREWAASTTCDRVHIRTHQARLSCFLSPASHVPESILMLPVGPSLSPSLAFHVLGSPFRSETEPVRSSMLPRAALRRR